MNVIAIPGFSEPVSSGSHLVASLFFLITTFFLIKKGRGNSFRTSSLLIYAFSNIFLFAMSGVYHLLEKGSTGSYVLQILDYSGIYFLIAGTFTPIHTILTRGASRWLILLIVWTFGLLGIIFTSIFFTSMPHWLSLSFFLAMGWLGIFTFRDIRKASRESSTDIMLSGFAYTIGAIIDASNWPILWEGVIGAHEVFHIFVVIGAAFNWRIVNRICNMPISPNLTVLISIFPDKSCVGKITTEREEFKAISVEQIKMDIKNWSKSAYFSEYIPAQITYKYSNIEKEYL